MGRWAQRRVRGGGEPAPGELPPAELHIIAAQIPGGDGTDVIRFTFDGLPPDPWGDDPTSFSNDDTGGEGTAVVSGIGVNQIEVTMSLANFDGNAWSWDGFNPPVASPQSGTMSV